MIRILSIDDSKAVHAFITTIFAPLPHELAHAYDGQEGLQLLQQKGESNFDLILLDWEMPKLTGIETLKQIRQLGFKLPVVMLTSKNAPEEIMNALALGASEYVMKPFTGDILKEKLETVLGRKLG